MRIRAKFLTFSILFLAGIFIELQCQIVEPLYNYGIAEFQTSSSDFDHGIVRLAEKELIQSIKNFPDNPSKDKAELLQANIDYTTGNLKLADNRLKDFLFERPNSPLIAHAAIMRAYFYFDKKDYSTAGNLFVEAKRIAEKEAQDRNDSTYLEYAHKALFWRATSLVQQGKYQEAEPFYVECFQKYPNYEYADDALFALGMSKEINKQYEAAVSYYTTIAKKYPYSNSFIASRIRDANNKLILRQAASAISSIENADIKLQHINAKDSIGMLYEPQTYSDNANENLQYLRGEAYNEALNFDKAIDVFKGFLGTYSQSPLLNYSRLGLAWALLNKNQNLEAIKYYDQVIKSADASDPSVKSTAQLYRTVALKRSGNIDQAKKDMTALSVQPSFAYLPQVLIELGQIYYEAGDFDEARRILEKADRESNDATASVRIHILLGATYMELGLWDKAVTEFKTAEQITLKSSSIFLANKDYYLAESRLKQGIALVKSHRNAEAIPSFLSFIAENRSDNRGDEALFWLGEAYYRSDMLKNSSETYQNLLEMYPNSQRKEEALYGLGWSYFRVKNFTKSSSTFDKMITEFPDSKYALEVLTRQGDGYYITKNFRKAADAYQKAAQRYPNTEEGQYSAYQMCHALYRLQSYEEAITNLLNFVRKYPSSSYAPYALYLIGWIRFQQGHYNEAIDNFKYLIQAYSQSSLVVRAYYAIGDAYYNMGNFDAAIPSYKTVVESYPSNPLASEAMRSLQYCLIALDRKDEAMKLADTFVESNPGSPLAEEFKFKKAEMFYSGKNYSDAISEYQNFIKNHPDSQKDAEAMYWMGKSYIQTNDADKAEQSFNAIQKKYPKSDFAPLSMLELGLLKKQTGNVRQADSIFKLLQKTYPENQTSAQAGFERALLHYAIGDTTKAISLFLEVADKYPDIDFADQSRYQVAMYYKGKGLNDSARMEFELLAQKMENPLLASEAEFRIGEMWMQAKNYEKAIAAFSIVKEKFAGNEDWFSRSLLNLGECYEQTGNNDGATEIYRTLESLRPDDDFGKTAKSRLKRLGK